VRRIVILRFVVLIYLTGLAGFGPSAYGQKRFDFNESCQKAYKAIIRLRLDEGSKLLEEEKKRDPDNLIPSFLENYIDFFALFFNEDPAEFERRKDYEDLRIQQMSEGPDNSPFNLFTRSIIRFQWAAIQVKFGNNWDAGWDFRRSFVESRECEQRFPRFAPAIMLSGAMQVVAGTIPDGYKWLSNLLGIKGSVGAGMRQLEGFLTNEDPWAQLFRDEATFYYLYLQFYIQNKTDEVFSYIRQHKLDLKGNYLYSYLAANLCINAHRSAEAEKIIRERTSGPGYLDMPVWDLEMGYAMLNHLDPEAPIYLGRFLSRFRGRFYIKDAAQKISWYYFLKGDLRKADSFRTIILQRGSAESDADKQALKEARTGKWPDRILLTARVLSDGGYFEEALRSLRGTRGSDFHTVPEQTEYTYRLGRIYDGLGRKEEAVNAYMSTIQTGEKLREYFAARAALQAGNIYEQQGDKAKAVSFYRKCLAMKDHDYKNSLDQRAKAGIARCNGE
jgi:tetratricopeptide (TPR) repeat protein